MRVVVVREQSVDAQAARTAGLAARRERIARAEALLEAARVPYRLAESRLLRLQRSGASPTQIAKARAALLATVPGVSHAQTLVAHARAPRRARPRLRDELASVAAQIESSNHRRTG